MEGNADCWGLKQKEQLQGVVRVSEENGQKKSSKFSRRGRFEKEKKKKLSDLTAVFALCRPDMCCTSSYCSDSGGGLCQK